MPDQKLAGRRVLLVEDEMLVAMLAEDMLNESGCDVVATGSVGATLKLLSTDQAFDAAVIDVNLEGQDSYEIAERLAAAAIPFAFATGYGAGFLPPDLSNRPVLTKPYDEAQLTGTVRALVETRPAR